MKKIRDKDATTLKIIKSITDNGSQITYIIGANTLSNKLVRELVKPTAIQGVVKIVDTQGKLTLQNTEKYVKAFNNMLSELDEYIDIVPDEELADTERKEMLKQSVAEYLDDISENDDTNPYKTILNIDLPYTNKILSQLSKGKIPKRLADKVIYPNVSFTSIFNPSINDTIIIFNNQSLPRNIDTNLLYDVISRSAENHYNIIFIEDKKKNCWKLSKLFPTQIMVETKCKTVQKKM